MEHARSIVAAGDSDIDRAVKIFYAVRDGMRYNPYRTTYARRTIPRPASSCPGRRLLRAEGGITRGPVPGGGRSLPAAVCDREEPPGHQRLRELMETDMFVFHGYDEFFLEGRWVKATPAFNLSLCEKFGIRPLEFDGGDDSILHPFDREGGCTWNTSMITGLQ